MRESSRITGGSFAVGLACFLFFFKLHPYFFWSSFFTNNYFEAVVTIIIGLLFLVNRKKFGTFEKLLFALFCLIVVLYPITSNQNFNVFVSVAPIALIPFAKKEFNERVYNTFLNLYCIILIPSLIVWLIHFTGLLTPRIIPPLNEIKTDNYQIYPLLAIEGHSFRFGGPFDEPGVIGTISALLLCINQLKLKGFKNIVLLLSGICSVSLFFYVIIGVYYVFSRLRSVKQVVIALSVIIVIVAAIQTVPVLREMITNRLSWDSDTGSIAGDNRTALFTIETLNRVQGTNEFWFGVNNKTEYSEKTAYSSSFLNVILLNGLIYFIIVVSFYILYGWYYRKDVLSFILFVIVFLGVIYQRPLFNNPSYVFLWIMLARHKGIIIKA